MSTVFINYISDRGKIEGSPRRYLRTPRHDHPFIVQSRGSMDYSNLSFHRYANLFPMMGEDEFASLVENIKAHGLRDKIWLYQGQVLDGRNRYLACEKASVMPQFQTFTGDEQQAIEAVLSWNLERRHLNAGQKAMIALEILPELEKLARQKQLEQASKGAEGAEFGSRGSEFGSSGGRGHKKPPLGVNLPQGGVSKPTIKPLPTVRDPRARDKAAQSVGVSSRSVQSAKKVQQARPDLAAEVKKGKITLNNAIKQAKQEEKQAVIEKAAESEELIPLERKVSVNVGDWWKLGRHVLYCGDTSKPEFIKKVPMSAMGFADPPYGANVESFDDSEFYWQHDWLIDKCNIVCVTPGIVSIFKFAKITNMPYLWSHSTWIKNGMTRGAIGFGNWIYTAIFSRSSIHRNAQDFDSITIETSTTEETTHKGRKPSKYLAIIFHLFTKDGDQIIDPFLGSGQTLLVAEKLNRQCFGGEIMPEHCELIINRWESMTGMKAEVIDVNSL